MALHKVKSDAIPQAYAVEITKAIPIGGPKLNKYPNFTESMHLILCLATVAFWELTRQDCSVRDGALTVYISVAGLYAIDYYSGFDRRPGDPNERCLYIPRFILYRTHRFIRIDSVANFLLKSVLSSDAALPHTSSYSFSSFIYPYDRIYK